MIHVSIIFVCLWSALMFWGGYFVHWLITPKVGFIHIEKDNNSEYDKFAIEFTKDPNDLYLMRECMLKVKVVDKKDNPDNDKT